MAQSGTVYLVGAGPGDPDLLTIKALKLIETADVVVYDRLVSGQILDLIPDGTTRVDVGKRSGHHPVPQDSITDILFRLASAGHAVVRLKGGDPMIFGRGGEEAADLENAGIPVVTVPGITAAQGCAASLNMPLTQRGVASSLMYMTGHTKEGLTPPVDWDLVARGETTVVIYMGTANINQISEKLTSRGLSPQTPALAIANGTTNQQKHISTTVSNLALDLEQSELGSPVLFIIGKAAGLISTARLERNASFETEIVASGS